MTTAAKAPAWYQSRLRLLGWGSALALLALPAVAMMAGAEGVDWSGSDFVLFAIMLLLLGSGIELAALRSTNLSYRLGAVAGAGTGFLTIWVNLAVGMIGSEDNPYNLLFFGVVGLAAAGALAVGGRAKAMAALALAAAVAQFGIAAAGYTSDPRGSVFSMAFALPWLLAAQLFRHAARRG